MEDLPVSEGVTSVNDKYQSCAGDREGGGGLEKGEGFWYEIPTRYGICIQVAWRVCVHI